MSEIKNASNTVTIQSDWTYLNLELIFDSVNPAEMESLKGLSIDSLSWKIMIERCLARLHGIIGEASHLDVLQLLNSKESKKLLIRIQKEDKSKFLNSLMANTFALNHIVGGSLDVNCYIRCNACSDFLGLVLDDSFM